MSAHTSGDWQLGDENNQCCSVLLGTEHNLTCSLDRQDGNTGAIVIDRQEMLANARLIAAAPELLAALNAMVTRIEFYTNWPEGRPNIEQWEYTDGSKTMQDARAAIAKATGEPA